MTMYITVATVDRVVQASDRRTTRFEGGKPVSTQDNKNKAVIVDCHNGRFSIVYCGYATIDGVPTSSVIAGIFSKINLASQSPKILFDSFIEELSEKFLEIGILVHNQNILKTNISIAGYIKTGDLFWLRISNYANKECDDIGIQNEFKYYGRLIDSPSHEDKTSAAYVEIGGISDAYAKEFLNNEILSLRNSNFFHVASGEEVASKLVEMIRAFATHVESKNLVGRNCMTTVLNAPPAGNHQFLYHDAGKNPVQYGPEFVFEDGWISNFEAGPIDA